MIALLRYRPQFTPLALSIAALSALASLFNAWAGGPALLAHDSLGSASLLSGRTIVISIWLTSSSLVALLAVGALAAEFERRAIAALCSGAVSILLAITIASWVLNAAPIFDFYLFGIPPLAPTMFPSTLARDVVIPLAVSSLVVFMLAIDRSQSATRALGWSTGLALLIYPVVRTAVEFYFSDSSIAPPPQSTDWRISTPFWFSVSALGFGILASRHTKARGVIDWGARVRTLIVVMVVGATLVLWHTVRSSEIRQLQNEIRAAAGFVAGEWQKGLNENIKATRRLGMHWSAGGNRERPWNMTDTTFLADARAFMRDYLGVQGIFVTDDKGNVLRAARRNIDADGAPSDRDEVVMDDIATLTERIAARPSHGASCAETIVVALAQRSQVRSGAALTPRGHPWICTPTTLVDEAGYVIGAMVIVFRRDINESRILGPLTPDFHLRLYSNGELTFTRPARTATNSLLARNYSARERVATTLSSYIVEVFPSDEIVARNLTWTPALVLLFAWVALSLLAIALYNERRAYLLAQERERIIDESFDVICTLDHEGRVLTVNLASEAILGYRESGLVGLRLSEIVIPEDREQLEKQWLGAQTGKHALHVPLRFKHQAGHIVYMQGNARWSPSEQIFYCDMRDVSEQRGLELERERAANTFSTAVEQAGCIVYEFAPDRNAIQWVGAVRALTGFEIDALVKLGFDGWMDLVHPEERSHVRATIERCLQSQQSHIIDYRLLRKDGTYVPVLDRGRFVAEQEAQPARMIGALIDLTAIRLQETALRRSEERYRIIATQVGAVIMEREAKTGRVRVFGPVEQIFGFTKEQIESRTYGADDTMVHSEDRPHVTAAVSKAERELSSYYIEYRRRHRSGHYIHIAARGVVLPGADGTAERSVIAITDITERKQAEQRLQESEERFRLAIEQSRQIVYELAIDKDLRVQSAKFSGAIEQLLGYAREEFSELQQSNHLALVHPDDLPLVGDLPATMAIEQGSVQIEHRLRHKNGHFIYVENRAAAHRDTDGKLIGIVGMLLDISSRKAVEAERHAYTAQLGRLADIARQVSTLLSLHELLGYLSKSMRELLGANAAAIAIEESSAASQRLVSASYADHYGAQHGAGRAFNSQPMHFLLAGAEKPVRITTAQMRENDDWSRLSLNDDLRHPLRGWLAAPLIARDGNTIGLIELTDKVIGDFTESDAQVLRQLAGLASVAVENIRLYATLEERVAERTRELQMSNRELEAFSYSVSHDLRAPLRAIAGFSKILQQEYIGNLDETAQRYLERITGGVERMASLIDDLLSLARVSRLELKREPIDLTRMAETVVQRQVERWPDRQFDIEVEQHLTARADPRLLEVAIENLVENAIKFTGTRPQTQIHIGQRNVDGRRAFYIADNGVGFDPKYATNLFGVFQRLHSASEFPGTGVGLATVQRIMQRHHGSVWAESAINHGATFYFAFDNEN